MSKKHIAVLLSAMIFAGTLTAIPASAAIDMQNLPEPITENESAKEVQKFKKTKPKLTLNNKPDNRYYYYGNYAYLSWEPVDHALLYYVYKSVDNGKFKKICSTYKTNYDDYETDDYKKNIRYAVKAVTYNYNDRAVYSLVSNYAVVKKTAQQENIPDYLYDDYYEEPEYAAMPDAMISYAPIQEAPVNNVAGVIPAPSPYPMPENTEEYSKAEESGFKNVATDPVSTFSADVDTASYANLRRLINDNDSIPEDAVRIEEMLNYFNYNYRQPTGKVPFSVTYELSDCPWNENSKLMMIGLQGKDIPKNETPASNFVFLIDTSGSMNQDDKLPLVKESIITLMKGLGKNDRVSIVTYSGNESIVLAGAYGNQRRTVKAMLDCMEAYGSTNGESGINAAYSLAEHYFIEGGNNRIIIATDGDLNVGISSEDELNKLITEKRKTGVYFTALGFGKGNLKDNKLETLADNGNGSYHYIDNAKEAAKVLIEERNRTLYTIAEDVKFQIEFNPKYVGSYRLIGYDNRRLNNEDFTDDTKDAGEVGAGGSVTVLYELKLAKSSDGSLKYQSANGKGKNEWCTLKLRYKNPGESESKQVSVGIDGTYYDPYEKMSGRMRFACAVAEFGLFLKDSDYKGSSSIYGVKKLLKDMPKDDQTSNVGYREDFEELVDKYSQNHANDQ